MSCICTRCGIPYFTITRYLQNAFLLTSISNIRFFIERFNSHLECGDQHCMDVKCEQVEK